MVFNTTTNTTTFDQKITIMLKNESEQDVKIFLDKSEVIMAIFTDETFSLELHYKSGKKGTIAFLDANEHEYKRIRDTFY